MPDSRPNLLFLFPDQWRGDCLGSLGHPVVETPFLDQMAAQGVTFTSAYSPCPSCVAARASLITGQTPSTNGRLGYQDSVPWPYPNTLMRVLRDGGYQTLMTGKTHFYPQRAALGFEEMRLYDTQHLDADFESDYHIWLHEKSGGLVRDTAREIEGNSWLACPWTHSESLHPTTWNVDRSIELLSRRDPTRPFFLMAGFHRPHPPLDPPLSFYERFADKPLPPAPVGDWASENDFPITNVNGAAGRLPPHVFERTRRAYYAQIAHIDYQIGRLLFWMQKRGLLQNTWVIFSSDHGELLGDHHQWRKFNALEGSAKVPLLIKPPPETDSARGSRCDAPVALYDLMPTLLEAAQIPIPESVEGRSLAPLVRGESPTWRDFVHGEHTRSNAGWHFVTDGREKFIWDSQSGREWFFDLQSDPQECRDLVAAPERAARVALWRSRLVETLAARPQDGLCDGHNLLPGRIAPTVRPQLHTL